MVWVTWAFERAGSLQDEALDMHGVILDGLKILGGGSGGGGSGGVSGVRLLVVLASQTAVILSPVRKPGYRIVVRQFVSTLFYVTVRFSTSTSWKFRINASYPILVVILCKQGGNFQGIPRSIC